MFDNIPDRLIEAVRGLAGIINPADRESLYYAAAGSVIAEYLGKIISDDDTADLTGQPVVHPPGKVWHGHVNRVVLLGESLFLLRSCPGFSEFCRRLRDRKLRPSFFEMLAAKQFFKAGFVIHARPESGIRGEDFDFIAVRDGETINVEVTALTVPSPSENTVLNALNQKRKQLPDTSAAVLYCTIPEQWLMYKIDWNFWLMYLANQFLAKTRRINHIVFWAEEHIDKGSADGGGGLIITRKTYPNTMPRIAMRDSSFLYGGDPNAPAREAIQSGVGLSEFEKR